MNDKLKFKVLVDNKENCIFVQHLDVIDLTSLRERAKTVFEHPGFLPGQNRFIDMRNCKFEMNADEIRQFSSMLTSNTEAGAKYQVAIILNDDLGHGMTRIFMSLYNSSAVQSEIFHIPRDALRWLGIAPDFKLPYL